jgi:hypothetical protein
MPEICRFYGIIIKMFIDDHVPPHFHVEYGNYKALINIRTGEIINGEFPVKQLKLVQAWVILHEEELINNFEGLRAEIKHWNKIKPLN